jgi:hypothetical protein
MPIWVLLAIWGGGDVLMLLGEISKQGRPDVAVGSHLGGMLFGWATLHFNLHWGSIPGFPRRRLRVFRPRVRVVAPDDFYDRDLDAPRPSSPPARSRSASATATARTAPAVDDDLDARLDDVLAKIARDGRGSLTPPEEEILEAASRRARERRETRR